MDSLLLISRGLGSAWQTESECQMQSSQRRKRAVRLELALHEQMQSGICGEAANRC